MKTKSLCRPCSLFFVTVFCVSAGVAATEPGIDHQAHKPRVEFLKVDAAGALLRLSATCSDAASAERLTQAALAKAAQVIYGIQV